MTINLWTCVYAFVYKRKTLVCNIVEVIYFILDRSTCIFINFRSSKQSQEKSNKQKQQTAITLQMYDRKNDEFMLQRVYIIVYERNTRRKTENRCRIYKMLNGTKWAVTTVLNLTLFFFISMVTWFKD